MNQKAIQKWFWDAWKYRVIIARTRDNRLWVSDTISLIAVNETDPVLDSRKIFPQFPEPGESFWSSKNDVFTRKGPDVQALIDRTLSDNIKSLTVTEWYKFAHPAYLRMLKTEDNQEIFINTNLLNLIIGPRESVSEYQFFGTKPNEVVLVKNKQDELIALLMPVKNTESR
jgi:hypothetical protein